MHTSKKLSVRIYDRLKWELDGKLYIPLCWWKLNGVEQQSPIERYKLMPDQFVAPAYDLGYLVRKLPSGWTVVTRFNDEWLASWSETADGDDWAETAPTPEDAIGLLVLRLYKEGILNRE